jgi:hypothetical protein
MAAISASATTVEKPTAHTEEHFDVPDDPDAEHTLEEREAIVRMTPEDSWTARC